MSRSFPQDHLWRNANNITFHLNRDSAGKWFLQFELSGSLGGSPFAPEPDPDGDLLDEPEIDPAEVMRDVMTELLARQRPR